MFEDGRIIVYFRLDSGIINVWVEKKVKMSKESENVGILALHVLVPCFHQIRAWYSSS